MENIKNLNNKFIGSDVGDNIGLNSMKKDKNISQVIHFKGEDFLNLDNFCKEMMWGISLNKEYSILVRVSYVKGKEEGDNTYDKVIEYKILGNLTGLNNISKHEDLYNWFVEYHDEINSRLEMSMDVYKYHLYEIEDFQFIIYIYSDEITKRLVKFRKDSLGSHKDLINVSKTVEAFNQMLPLSYNKGDFGTLLNKKIVNKSIKSIELEDGTEINILELINNNLPFNKKLTKINDTIDFYQNNVKGRSILISVESLNNKNIINIYKTNGMHMYLIVDERINYNVFSRTIGNVKSYIDNSGIYRRDIIINFPRVYSLPYKGRYSRMLHPEWKIGTLDIETYTINMNENKAYAIGFYVKGNVETFYVNESLNSDILIKECLDKMLTEKYSGYTFYVHNLGGYDNYYIIPVLLKCINLYPEIYSWKAIFRDERVIGIKVTKKVKKYKEDDKKDKKGKKNTGDKNEEFYFKTYSIRIVDSYTLLAAPLNELCVTFNTEVRKSVFPYSFIHKNNLFYVGKKPDIEFFKVIIKDKVTGINREELMDINEYNQIKSNNWSVKEETLDYLANDLVSLYEVIEKFSKDVYINYKVHVVESLTISGLTMDVFLRNYYRKSDNIPLIKQKSIYNDIKKSYYGGITEVYKPYGKKLYLYDVNSLYPFAALNAMPGINCIYRDNINMNFSELKDNIFGFFHCKVNAPKNYLGLLPYRTKTGLISPVGLYEGWYFSEELRFAYENGYDIHIISGYQFDKSENLFNSYVKDLYKIKSTTKDDIIKAITKSFLNNLLGRWGLDINKYITRFVSHDEFEWIRITRKIRSFNYIEDKVLVTYDKEISEEVCESHNLDYMKVLESQVKDQIDAKNALSSEHDKFNDVSVAISSAITAYARVFMNRVKLDILNKGGYLYYTDTDSIVTDIKLDDNLVGKDIGQFKLVHEIEEAYFISNKSYALKTSDGKTIIKSKGFTNVKTLDGKTKYLSFEDFEKVYRGDFVEGTRYESKRDYNRGVLINIPNKLELSPFSYIKRAKVLDKNKLWVDTFPIVMHKNMYHTQKEKGSIVKRLFIWCGVLMLYTVCVISCVLWIILVSHSHEISNDITDILNITDLSDIVDYTDISDYSDYISFIDININSDCIEKSILREKFDEFIKLFSSDKSTIIDKYNNHIKYVNNSTNLYTNVKEDSVISISEHAKVDITKPLLRYNLESLVKDVGDLQDQVSLLKIELQDQKIHNIDVKKYYEKTIDIILHDLEEMQNKISRSPKL